MDVNLGDLLGPILHLLGVSGLGLWAYAKFTGKVDTRFTELNGHIDLVKAEVAGTNQRLDLLWNKEHERLRVHVEELEKRLRAVEQREAA
jgi:hypothetical protein